MSEIRWYQKNTRDGETKKRKGREREREREKERKRGGGGTGSRFLLPRAPVAIFLFTVVIKLMNKEYVERIEEPIFKLLLISVIHLIRTCIVQRGLKECPREFRFWLASVSYILTLYEEWKIWRSFYTGAWAVAFLLQRDCFYRHRAFLLSFTLLSVWII